MVSMLVSFVGCKTYCHLYPGIIPFVCCNIIKKKIKKKWEKYTLYLFFKILIRISYCINYNLIENKKNIMHHIFMILIIFYFFTNTQETTYDLRARIVIRITFVS